MASENCDVTRLAGQLRPTCRGVLLSSAKKMFGRAKSKVTIELFADAGTPHDQQRYAAEIVGQAARHFLACNSSGRQTLSVGRNSQIIGVKEQRAETCVRLLTWISLSSHSQSSCKTMGSTASARGASS